MKRRYEPLPKDFDKKKGMKTLLKAMSPYKSFIIVSAILVTAATALSVLAPSQLSRLTDAIQEGAATHSVDLDRITSVSVILIMIYGSSAMMNAASGIIMNRATQTFSREMRKSLSDKINKIPLGYYDKRLYGDTLSVVTNDVDVVGESMKQSVSSLISSVFMLIGVLVAMFVTRFEMALTALLTVPLMVLSLTFITKVAVPQFRKRQKTLGELNGKIEENFTGQTVITAFGAEKRKGEDFEKSNRELRSAMLKAQAVSGVMQPMMSLVSYFAYVAVCVVGGLLLADGKITIGTITAFLVYVNLFQHPLGTISQSFNVLQAASASAERVYSLLDGPEEEDESAKPLRFTDETGRINVRGEVEFKSVCFGYTPDKRVIDGFSAKIEPGMKVAIVGRTGAGKTTLVNLLMRFYETDEGDITVDGISVKDISRKELRSLFGMVLQDAWIFDGTVRENILFPKGNVNEDRLEEICKQAGISYLIGNLSGGLDHVVGDRSNVSGGQKQLIAIARAMAENAPMLILDEATSNVDTRTEESIQRAMDNLTGGRTSFVIAHRLSTVKNADMILVVDGGNVVEQGTHDELLALGGKYAELYNSQFSDKN